MYLFTTTTLINANAYLGNEDDKIFEAKTLTDGTKVLSVKCLNDFKKDNIESVVKSVGLNEKKDSVEFDLSSYITAGALKGTGTSTTPGASGKNDLRIALYVRSVGNADPMYANDLVFKGKPLYIELPVGTKTTDIVAVAKKYLNVVFGGIELLTVAFADNKLTLTAINGYLRITKAELLARTVEKSYGLGVQEYDFIKVADGTITKGHEGFGTYEQILKDLRLPTGANLRWKRTMEDEMPEPGELYDEYVLTYCKNRGIMGLSAVGSEVTSKTTHVFLVKLGEVSDAFTAALTTAGLSTGTAKTGTTGGDRESETIYTPYGAATENASAGE